MIATTNAASESMSEKAYVATVAVEIAAPMSAA